MALIRLLLQDGIPGSARRWLRSMTRRRASGYWFGGLLGGLPAARPASGHGWLIVTGAGRAGATVE